MPCNSDYMEQNNKEKQLQETAKILSFVLEARGKEVTTEIKQASNDYYCKFENGVKLLCDEFRSMNETEMDTIVYNGRDSMSRRTANWFEIHEEADKLREVVSTQAELQKRVKEIAIAKLTPAEIEVLGIKV